MPDDAPRRPEWKLGPKLAAALDSLNWNDRQLAEKIGVSTQTVNNFRRGYASHNPDAPFRPRAGNVVKMARALRAAGADVDVAEWLRDAGHDPSAYIEAGEDQGLRSRRIGEKSERLTANEQRIVEELVDALLLAHGYVLSPDPTEPPAASRYEFASEGVRSAWSETEGSVPHERVD